ncbi:MAG: DUF1207 domain-containing protein [Gemmatimonadota bacterium]
MQIRFPTLLAIALGLGARLCPLSAQADGLLLPNAKRVAIPLASPRAEGIVGRIIQVTRAESQFGPEREADVAMGETFPVLGLSRGRIPVMMHLGAEVYGRFSLDDPGTSLISSDWVVGIHTVADLGAWQIDLHIYHESSHLGDEYAEHFKATRLDWTREVATLGARYQRGRLGISGYASYTLIDKLPLAKPAAAFAIDYNSPHRQFLGSQARLVAGVYTEAQAYAGWKVSSAARVGGVVRGQNSRREMGLGLIYFDGISTQRQFYKAKSRYYGLELRFGL